MLVSVSTAKVERYEWFTYYGRPKVFESHNRKYDLALEPRDKFGVRKFGAKYKVLEASDTKIIFTLSQREVDSLIKKSKGFSGKVDGKKVTRGIGGLEPTRKRKTSKPKSTKIARRFVHPVDQQEEDIYPHVDIPVTKSELTRLFHLLNKKYFDNMLNPRTKLVVMNAYRVTGRAFTEWIDDRIIRQAIRINKSALTNRKRLVNVLLHEMVHLKHKILSVEHGLDEYDETDIRNGHGPKFVAEVRKLNSYGFEVSEYTEDTPEDILDIDLYTLIVYNNDICRGVYSHSPFKEHVDDILEEYGTKLGRGMFTDYAYGKSRDPIVTKFPSLTSKFRLSNKRKNFVSLVMSKHIHRVISGLKNIKRGKLVVDHDTAEVNQEIVALLPHSEKIRVHEFTYFAYTIMGNVNIPEYKEAASHPVVRQHALDVLTEADRKYMYQFWKDTPDNLFMKNKHFEQQIMDIARHMDVLYELQLRGKSDSAYEELYNELAETLKRLYQFYFKGRKSMSEAMNFLSRLVLKQKMSNANEVSSVFADLKKRMQRK